MKQKIKIFYYFFKRHLKLFIITYLLIMLPFGYMMTAASTQYKIKDYKNTSIIHIKSGPINIFTMGLWKPIKSSVYICYGSIQHYIGSKFNNQLLINNAENLVVTGHHWFELGTVSSPKKGQIDKFNYFTYPNYYQSLGLSNINKSKFPKVGHTQYSKNSIKSTFTKNSMTQSKNNYNVTIKNNKKIKTLINNKSYYNKLYINNFMLSTNLNGDKIKDNNFIATYPFKSAQNKVDRKIIDYINQNPNDKVYYQASLHYNKRSDLIPTYMIINVISNSEELNDQYQIFNNAKGWIINYKNGKSKYEWGK